MSRGGNENRDCGVTDIDELLSGVCLSMPSWERKLQHTCPFCGRDIEYRPQPDPGILAFRCECGHNGFVMGPYEERDKRYEPNFEDDGFVYTFTDEE